jgi:hypothetical protein
VKESKVAQLPIFEANTTRRLRLTKKNIFLKKEQPIILPPLDQTAVDHVRALPSKSSEGWYPMLD